MAQEKAAHIFQGVMEGMKFHIQAFGKIGGNQQACNKLNNRSRKQKSRESNIGRMGNPTIKHMIAQIFRNKISRSPR